MSNKSVFIKWTYGPDYKTVKVLPDPRIAIVRQLDWTRSTTAETMYALPEPDNYNRAVFARRPQVCDFIEDQVIYKNDYHNGWFTVAYVPEDKLTEFDAWAGAHGLAIWRHSRPSQFKQPKLLLDRREYYKELSTNERLLTMGYYKKFAVKYFEGDTKIVKSLIGEPRGNLIDFVPENEVAAL